jgi:hypothetical protein
MDHEMMGKCPDSCPVCLAKRQITPVEPGLQIPTPFGVSTSDTAKALVEKALGAKDSTEVRVTSATGGQKGVKLARYDLIPEPALEALAETYGRGAKKYAPNNYRKGYDWGLSVGAMRRHLGRWLRGETFDEDGHYHLIQVAWHAFTLFIFQKYGLGTDDRADLDLQPNATPKEPK